MVRLLVIELIFSILVLTIGVDAAKASVDDNLLCAVEITMPVYKQVDNRPYLVTHHVGEQLVFTATLLNSCDQKVPFIAFIEIRDSADVTVSLHNQTGTIGAKSHSEVAMAWWPEEPGDYELRTFAISNFTKPEILTSVRSNQVEIHDQ
ncbi:MAG: hypothetical protein MN733_04355 [Nitrososphaera sp.]|nr:hypothetical protein [Nitrososphaera sp.]